MDESNLLNQVFESSEAILSQRLKAIRAAYKHGGMKGSAVEEAFRQIFEEFLPDNIGVDTGIIVDVDGNSSKQLDIICYDKAKTPRFFRGGGASVFPIECVYFVFEVKTKLTSDELRKIYLNLDSVKKMKKKAYFDRSTPYAMQFQIWGEAHQHFPVMYGVLALEGVDTENFTQEYIDLQGKRTLGKRVDSMFVLGIGTYLNVTFASSNTTQSSFFPTPKSFVAIKKHEALMTFWAIFSVMYSQASMPQPFDFSKYVNIQQNEFRLIGLRDSNILTEFIVEYMLSNSGNFPAGMRPADTESEELIRRQYLKRLTEK